jgi:hypothetical protein
MTFIFLGLYQTSQQGYEFDNPNISSTLQEPTVLTIDVLENQSINWFRTRIVLNITVDIPINMSYFISGIEDNADKVLTTNSSIFLITPTSSQIDIILRPLWSVFPSVLHYQLSLYYINATTQIPQLVFEIPSGTFNIIMGLPLSMILGGVLIIGVIIIIVRPVRLRQQKNTTSLVSSFETSGPAEISSPLIISPPSTPLENKGAGKIQCPECKKNIAEGSAFCPECGYHIPRFLRTKE